MLPPFDSISMQGEVSCILVSGGRPEGSKRDLKFREPHGIIGWAEGSKSKFKILQVKYMH